MELEKVYQGTIAQNTAKTITMSYGMTNTVSVSQQKTEVLNNALVDILTEAGVDCEYKNNFLWVYGVPFGFYIYTNYNYYYLYGPFNTTALFNNTSYGVLFNGMNYYFKIKVAGFPETGISIIFTTGGTSTAGWSSNTGFKFAKAKRTITGNPAVVYGPAGVSFYGVEFNSDGTPKDVGRSANGKVYAGTNDYLLNLTADDAVGATTFPLVRQVNGPFMVDNAYMYPNNFGLTVATTLMNPQVFVTIGGREFWLSQHCLGVGLMENLIGS